MCKQRIFFFLSVRQYLADQHLSCCCTNRRFVFWAKYFSFGWRLANQLYLFVSFFLLACELSELLRCWLLIHFVYDSCCVLLQLDSKRIVQSSGLSFSEWSHFARCAVGVAQCSVPHVRLLFLLGFGPVKATSDGAMFVGLTPLRQCPGGHFRDHCQ